MSRPPLLLPGLIAVWALAAGSGFLVLGAYHSRPGSSGTPLDRWPSDVTIPLDKSLPTLLIFIHPRCPCSPASLAELEEVSAHCQGRFRAYIVTFRPDGRSEGWSEAARDVGDDRAGPSRLDDPGGRLAARFGVETSGHVLLFEPSGRRLFSGGITISRGHRGPSPGLDRLISSIQGVPTVPGSTPVFGCPVLGPRSGQPGGTAP